MFPAGLVAGIISLVMGILILVKPNLLAYLVAFYLILVGLIAIVYTIVRF